MRLSECLVRTTIDVIDGKWKPIIVNELKDGMLRFGQLQRRVPEAARKVLTEQLRELEEDEIVSRKAAAQKWQRVEYALTPYGRTLAPVLSLMAKWGQIHRQVAQGSRPIDHLAARRLSQKPFHCTKRVPNGYDNP